MTAAAALLLGAAALWAGGPAAKPASALFPEDLGPAEIDVSDYPEEHQKTYRELFLPVFGFLGGPARAVNSPLIELDPRLEEAERRKNPRLFSDRRLARPGRESWKKRVEEIRLRPPCCGACPVLSRDEARALWRFLVYDSVRRKTGDNAASWLRQRKRLIKLFRKKHQQPYQDWVKGLESAPHGGT